MLLKTKNLLLASALFAFAACNNGKNEHASAPGAPTAAENTPADPKALMHSFESAWNKKDSAAVASMIADDAILFSGRNVMNGKKEITDSFLHYQIPVTSSLTTNSSQASAGNDLAYTAGTWTLDVNVPNKPVWQASGNHTFIWKKQPDGTWKLVLLNIEDHDPETPQQETKK